MFVVLQGKTDPGSGTPAHVATAVEDGLATGYHRRDVLRHVPLAERCQCDRSQRSLSPLEKSVPERKVNRLSGIPRVVYTDEQLLELIDDKQSKAPTA